MVRPGAVPVASLGLDEVFELVGHVEIDRGVGQSPVHDGEMGVGPRKPPGVTVVAED